MAAAAGAQLSMTHKLDSPGARAAYAHFVRGDDAPKESADSGTSGADREVAAAAAAASATGEVTKSERCWLMSMAPAASGELPPTLGTASGGLPAMGGGVTVHDTPSGRATPTPPMWAARSADGGHVEGRAEGEPQPRGRGGVAVGISTRSTSSPPSRGDDARGTAVDRAGAPPLASHAPRRAVQAPRPSRRSTAPVAPAPPRPPPRPSPRRPLRDPDHLPRHTKGLNVQPGRRCRLRHQAPPSSRSRARSSARPPPRCSSPRTAHRVARANLARRFLREPEFSRAIVHHTDARRAADAAPREEERRAAARHRPRDAARRREDRQQRARAAVHARARVESPHALDRPPRRLALDARAASAGGARPAAALAHAGAPRRRRDRRPADDAALVVGDAAAATARRPTRRRAEPAADGGGGGVAAAVAAGGAARRHCSGRCARGAPLVHRAGGVRRRRARRQRPSANGCAGAMPAAAELPRSRSLQRGGDWGPSPRAPATTNA